MAVILGNVSMSFTLHSDRVDNDNDIIIIVNTIPMCFFICSPTSKATGV